MDVLSAAELLGLTAGSSHGCPWAHGNSGRGLFFVNVHHNPVPSAFGGHSPKLSCWLHPGNTDWSFILPLKNPAALCPQGRAEFGPCNPDLMKVSLHSTLCLGERIHVLVLQKFAHRDQRMPWCPPNLMIKWDPDPNAWFCCRQLNQGGFF